MPWFAYYVPGHGVRQVYGSNRTEADVAIKAAYPNEPGAADAYQSQTATEDPFTYYQFAGGGGLGPGGVIGGGGPGTGGGIETGGGVGGGAIGSTTLPRDLQADLDFAAPASAFRAGLRQRGFNPEGPLGGLLDLQFPTAQANFGLRNFLEGTSLTGVPPNSFRDYTANRDPNASSDALALYKNVQGGAGIPQKSLRNALYSAGISDTKEQRGFQQNFGDVARGAARARYSPFSARFLPSETTLDREFDDLLYAQGLRGKDAQGVNLLKFLQEQYGF